MNETLYSLKFRDIDGLSNPGQNTRPSFNQHKKDTYSFVDFVVPVDYRGKIKESERINK